MVTTCDTERLLSLYFNMVTVLKRKGENTQEFFHWRHKAYSKYFQVTSKGQECAEEEAAG